MGCGGSKSKTNKPKRKPNNREDTYRQRSGFTITKDMVDTLSEIEQSEYVIKVDVKEFFSRQELPNEKYIDLLTAIKENNSKKYNSLLKKYKMSTMDGVTGIKGTVDFGSKKNIKSEDLNPLHWAVYSGNLKAIEAICNTQIFNIVIAGKVPSNTGMANESEISIDETKMDRDSASLNRSKSTKYKEALAQSDKRFGSNPRNLLLFFAIEQENVEMFKYLWNTLYINWGLKSLKFNLTMLWIKENNKMIETWLLSDTFVKIINSLPFDEAMDFLEIFVIKNDRVADEVKTELFHKKKALNIYDFVGELMWLEDSETWLKFYEKLSPEDLDRVKNNEKAMAKIKELKKYVDNIEESEQRDNFLEILGEFVSVEEIQESDSHSSISISQDEY
jgi:hypothetical protein